MASADQNLLKQSLVVPVRVVPVLSVDHVGGFPYTLPFRLDLPSITYHSIPFDQSLQNLTRLDWQKEGNYTQKWQLTDPIPGIYSIPVDSYLTAAIYDCHGQKVADIPETSITEFSGNNIYGIRTKSYFFSYSYEGLLLNTGNYIFVLALTALEQIHIYRSDTQEVKNNHFGTKLIEYNDRNNRVDFYSIAPGYNIRVEAELKLSEWEYADTNFLGQNGENSITYSRNNRKYDFVVGAKNRTRQGNIGVARWMIDKLVNIMGSEELYVDAECMVRATGVNPEIEDYGQRMESTATFKLYEQNIGQRRIFGTVLARYEFPISYPYAVASLYMDGTQISSGDIISDISDLVALKDHANMLGRKGTFTLDGTTLIYTNGRSEFVSLIEGVVIGKRVRFSVYSPSGSDWNSFSYRGGTILIDFGDGTYDTFANAGTTIFIAHTYDYTASDAYEVTVWHQDNIQEISFNPPNLNDFELDVFNTSDILPLSLQSLEINGQPDFSTMIKSILNPGLTSLTITGCGLNTLSNPFFTSRTNLNRIDLRGNKLDDTDLNDFTFTLVGAVDNDNRNGNIKLEGQTPPAPPSSGTLANLNVLRNSFGWTYSTD